MYNDPMVSMDPNVFDISENILQVKHPVNDSTYPHKTWIEVKYIIDCDIYNGFSCDFFFDFTVV